MHGVEQGEPGWIGFISHADAVSCNEKWVEVWPQLGCCLFIFIMREYQITNMSTKMWWLLTVNYKFLLFMQIFIFLSEKLAALLKIAQNSISEYFLSIWLAACSTVSRNLIQDQSLDYVLESYTSAPACITECQDHPNYSTKELTYTYINWTDSNTCTHGLPTVP